MAEDDKTVSVEVKSLKKGGFCMIRDQPCRITEMTQKPKATSKGNDRIHLVGLHMATGKKYEDTLLATLQIDEILVSRMTYDVLDVDTHQGTVSVLLKSGETKDDLNLEGSENPQEQYSPVCRDLVTRFEAGEELRVVVQGALGQETIVEVVAA
jgi:translation elongation factor P/translation initiation factor 5A